MAKIDSKILNDIKKLIEELNIKDYNILEAYIFGSYAKNKQKDWSDIDIALVSDKFAGSRFIDKDKIRDIYLKINWKLSPYPITIKQFNEDWFVKSEIIDKGIKIYPYSSDFADCNGLYPSTTEKTILTQ